MLQTGSLTKRNIPLISMMCKRFKNETLALQKKFVKGKLRVFLSLE